MKRIWKPFRGLVLLTALLIAGTAPAGHAEGAEGSASPASAAPIDSSPAASSPESPDVPSPDAKLASPESAIETFHAGLIGIMKDAKTLGFEGRIGRLEPLMGEVFDLDFMASKTVGSYWRKLSDADKKRWMKAFARLTTANYAGRFTGYDGESFETTGVEDAARDTKLVLTKIVIPTDEDVEINYRLIEKNGEWRVIDVYLDGTVSELALRRSEYSSALKREGFEQLVASVETKIADLKAKGLADG